MIKAIFFDMGGVLLPLFPERSMEAYRELAGFKDIDKYLDPCHQHGIFLDIEAGRMDLDTFFKECLKHCAPGTTLETVYRCQSAFFGTPKPEDVALVKELAQQYDIYLLSNNNAFSMQLHIPNFEKAGLPLQSSFKQLFFSHELKLLKPSPEIYLYALEHSGHSAAESLFIDDSQRNVDGAIAVGMHAVLYRPGEETLREVLTNTLNELNR